MPITPRERLARMLDGSQAPGAFSAQLSVPARASGSPWRAWADQLPGQGAAG